MTLAFSLVLLLLATPLIVAIMRANELFFLQVRKGRVRVRRGRLPQRLLDDIGDVVRSVEDASLRAVHEGGRPRLYAEGKLSPEVKQRLRNVIGTWSVLDIKRSPKARGN